MSSKQIFLITIGVLLGFSAVYVCTSTWERLDADEIMVIQSPIDGRLDWHVTAGIKWQGFGRVTKYSKLETYEFKIPIRFNDGGHGTMIGSINYEIPLDKENLTQLHVRYGSQDAVQKDIIEVVTNKCVYMTGPLMSSKESYAEKRTSLIWYVEDQIQYGVYKTSQKEVKTIDPMTNQSKTVTVAEIVVGDDGVPKRQEEAVLSSYGIKTSNFAVSDLPYDPDIEKQIKQQQEAIMGVQTAMAEAKKAEQQAITVAKEGEANAARAKWEKEVEKAKDVVDAEKRLAVAKLDKESAEQGKLKNILEGEGEATKRKLIMEADGALQIKIDALKEINQMYADAIAKYPGAWVPAVVMGSGNAGAGSGALDLIELLKVKTARDLSLDMSLPMKTTTPVSQPISPGAGQ